MLLRLYLPVSSKFGYSLVRKKSYDLILERDRNLNLVYFSRLAPLTPHPFPLSSTFQKRRKGMQGWKEKEYKSLWM